MPIRDGLEITGSAAVRGRDSHSGLRSRSLDRASGRGRVLLATHMEEVRIHLGGVRDPFRRRRMAHNDIHCGECETCL